MLKMMQIFIEESKRKEEVWVAESRRREEEARQKED